VCCVETVLEPLPKNFVGKVMKMVLRGEKESGV